MAYTEKQGQYSIEYAKKNLKRIPLDVKREYYDEVIVKAAEKDWIKETFCRFSKVFPIRSSVSSNLGSWCSKKRFPIIVS